MIDVDGLVDGDFYEGGCCGVDWDEIECNLLIMCVLLDFVKLSVGLNWFD